MSVFSYMTAHVFISGFKVLSFCSGGHRKSHCTIERAGSSGILVNVISLLKHRQNSKRPVITFADCVQQHPTMWMSHLSPKQ